MISSIRAASTMTIAMKIGSLLESTFAKSIPTAVAPLTSSVAPVARATGGSSFWRSVLTRLVVAADCGELTAYAW
jgi:hypothetical protein